MASVHWTLSDGREKLPSIWGTWFQSGDPIPSVYFPTSNPLDDQNKLREIKEKGTSLDNRWEEFIALDKKDAWNGFRPVISRKEAEERAKGEYLK
jgi:hypothetical protein